MGTASWLRMKRVRLVLATLLMSVRSVQSETKIQARRLQDYPQLVRRRTSVPHNVRNLSGNENIFVRIQSESQGHKVSKKKATKKRDKWTWTEPTLRPVHAPTSEFPTNAPLTGSPVKRLPPLYEAKRCSDFQGEGESARDFECEKRERSFSTVRPSSARAPTVAPLATPTIAPPVILDRPIQRQVVSIATTTVVTIRVAPLNDPSFQQIVDAASLLCGQIRLESSILVAKAAPLIVGDVVSCSILRDSTKDSILLEIGMAIDNSSIIFPADPERAAIICFAMTGQNAALVLDHLKKLPLLNPFASANSIQCSLAADTHAPSAEPMPRLTTTHPTVSPSGEPTDYPTKEPTESPTINPTETPTTKPTVSPTINPTETHTQKPSESPTIEPSIKPSTRHTTEPTPPPSVQTGAPSINPIASPTGIPVTPSTSLPLTSVPIASSSTPITGTLAPTTGATAVTVTSSRTNNPMQVQQTRIPITNQATGMPSLRPSVKPTSSPILPTGLPSGQPLATTLTLNPSLVPSKSPSGAPTKGPEVATDSLTAIVPATQFSVDYSISSIIAFESQDFDDAALVTCEHIRVHVLRTFNTGFISVKTFFCTPVQTNETPLFIVYDLMIAFDGLTAARPATSDIDVLVETALQQPNVKDLISNLQDLEDVNPFSTTTSVAYSTT